MTTTVTSTGITFDDSTVQTTAFKPVVPDTLTAASSVTINMANGPNYRLTMNQDITLAAPSNIVEGQSGFIEVIQNGTGGYWLSFAETVWEFEGGAAPYIDQGANDKIILKYKCTASTVIIMEVGRNVVVETSSTGLTMKTKIKSTNIDGLFTVPVETVPGDFLVLCGGAQNTSESTPIGDPTGYEGAVMDNGWTKIRSDGISGWSNGYGIWVKIATEDDPGTQYAGINGNEYSHNTCYVFRGLTRYAAWKPHLESASLTNTNPSTRTVAASTLSGDVVVIGMVGGGSLIPSYEGVGNYTDPALTQQNADIPMRCGINLYPDGTAAVDQKVDKSDTGVDNYAGAFAFELITVP